MKLSSCYLLKNIEYLFVRIVHVLTPILPNFYFTTSVTGNNALSGVSSLKNEPLIFH